LKRKTLDAITVWAVLAALTVIPSCTGVTKPAAGNAVRTEIDVNASFARKVSPLLFGFNYWNWVDKFGYSVSNTETLVRPLKIAILRAGGINNDTEKPQELSGLFLARFGNYCKAIGAQPLLQVPVASRGTVEERITRATNLIREFISMGYSLPYVSIGNEPDGYKSLNKSHPGLEASEKLEYFNINDYIDNFTNISAAVKREFPGIKIVGLELGWKYREWVRPFISKCFPYMDILSLHRYGYWPVTAATYDAAIKEYDDLRNFYSGIRTLTDPYAPGIPLIIGEMNSSADGDVSKAASSAMPGTFNAALWVADNIGVSSSEPNLLSVMPWSISEGWRLGFIKAKAGSHKVTPSYYTYLLFSNHIKEYMIFIHKINEKARIYIYRDEYGNVSVFCVNWSSESYQDVKINFNGVLRDSSINYRFVPSSFTCLEISKDLMVKKAFTYTSEMADAQSPYLVEDF